MSTTASPLRDAPDSTRSHQRNVRNKCRSDSRRGRGRRINDGAMHHSSQKIGPAGKVAGAPRNSQRVVLSAPNTRSPNIPTKQPASRLSLALINVSGRSGAITVSAIMGFSPSKNRLIFWLCAVSISTLSEKPRCITPSARNTSKLPR